MAKNGIGKIIAGVLCAAILAGGICAAGYCSRDDDGKWFRNSDFASWAWTKDKPQNEHEHTYDLENWVQGSDSHWHKSTCEHYIAKDVEAHKYKNNVCTVCGYKFDGKVSDMIMSDCEAQGLALTSSFIDSANYVQNGISAYAASAYTLTATVLDEAGSSNGMPQFVNFVVSWLDPDSANVQGLDVNNYVIATRVSDNSANIVCLKAFPEPIIIIVKANNSEVSATKRCDYVKRISSYDFEIDNGSNNIALESLSSVYNYLDFGAGTLSGNVNIDFITFYLSDDFISALTNSAYYKYFAKLCSDNDLELDLSKEIVCEYNCDIDSLYTVYFGLTDLLKANMDNSSVQQIVNNVGLDYFKYAVIEAAQKVSFCISLTMNYSYEYNGIIYNSGVTAERPYHSFNVSALGNLPDVGDITLDEDGNFIF